MREAYKPFRQGTNASTLFLTNAAATYYTVPAAPENITAHVLGLILANEDTVSRTVTIHNVDEGASAATSNRIFPPITIEAKKVIMLCLKKGVWMLTKGMTIQALADANSVVTITINGMEETP